MKYGVNILALYWEEMGFKIFFFLEYKRVQEKDVKKKILTVLSLSLFPQLNLSIHLICLLCNLVYDFNYDNL